MSQADYLLQQSEIYYHAALGFEVYAQQGREISPEERTTPVAVETNPLHVFYRVQPKGKELLTHTSRLAYQTVPGVFAFERPETLHTYTWLHIGREYETTR